MSLYYTDHKYSVQYGVLLLEIHLGSGGVKVSLADGVSQPSRR